VQVTEVRLYRCRAGNVCRDIRKVVHISVADAFWPSGTMLCLYVFSLACSCPAPAQHLICGGLLLPGTHCYLEP
jgi:hypothetical protein